MKNVPKELRAWLAERVTFVGSEIAEIQGPPDRTQKVLFRLVDGELIEGVVMRDEGTGRTGLCLSSQVGCAVGCTFCLTGYGGFRRHCTAEEIVSQVLEIRREALGADEPIHSIVFMGMGEPMLNMTPVIKAVGLLSDPEGVAISARRITVSTSGVIPGIEVFGKAATGANLAVSLNATTDKARTAIMPLNARWPIADLIESLRQFPMKPRQRLTMEYVLMRGVNDTRADASRLAGLLRPLRCKINLIMFNPHKLLDYQPVDDEKLQMFVQTLADADYTVSVRWSKGREIEAACGQLAAHALRREDATL